MSPVESAYLFCARASRLWILQGSAAVQEGVWDVRCSILGSSGRRSRSCDCCIPRKPAVGTQQNDVFAEVPVLCCMTDALDISTAKGLQRVDVAGKVERLPEMSVGRVVSIVS